MSVEEDIQTVINANAKDTNTEIIFRVLRVFRVLKFQLVRY